MFFLITYKNLNKFEFLYIVLKTLNFIRTEPILKQNVKRNSADISNSVSMSKPSSFVGSKPNRRFFQANEPNRTFHQRNGP